MVITIWDKVLLKLIASFDGLAIGKKVFLYYSNIIEIHIDVVVEVIEVKSSVFFEFCIDDEFIELW